MRLAICWLFLAWLTGISGKFFLIETAPQGEQSKAPSSGYSGNYQIAVKGRGQGPAPSSGYSL
jgi:hypothetical protein